MHPDGDAPLDLDALFDRDYLAFYSKELHDDFNDDEVEIITTLSNLQSGQRVLDLPCGHGRIARRLAQRGAEVTGVDRCELFLDTAREDAKQHGVDVDYRVGDMRTFEPERPFDLVLNWFTSFGYFDDDTLKDILRRLRRATAPGGQLIMESMNLHEHTLTDHESTHTKELVDDEGTHFLIDRSRFDPTDCRIHCRRFIARSGQPTREIAYQLRLFAFPELRSWLHDAGFPEVHAFGGEGEVLRVDSARMIVVAR